MTLTKKLSLKVPVKNILGLSYFKYDLRASNYNPHIDDIVIISCITKNIFNKPIKDKTLTLYKNGNSVGNATTNTNGVATWTITLSDWNNHHFRVEDVSLDLKATGFKTIAGESTGSWWLVRDETTAILVLNAWTCQPCNTTQWTPFGGEDYASTCKPMGFAMGLAHNNNVVFRISPSGGISYRALKTDISSTQDRDLYASITWKIRESDL